MKRIDRSGPTQCRNKNYAGVGEVKRLYIRVTLGLDPGKDKAKRKERKDISLFNVRSNTVVTSSLALSQVRRAARAGAGERLRGMLVQLLESPGRTSPGCLLLFRLDGNRPRARRHSVGDMQRKPLG